MISGIKNIIFDFGGVVLNLDEQRTYNAMAEILECRQIELMPKLNTNEVFHDLECGRIEPEKFIDFVKSIAPKPITTKQITDAWNAMLLDFPIEHVDLLIQLQSKYRTFLLSNTNAIHEEAFVAGIKNQGILYTLQDMFETVWYSHELGLRKPNHDIFEAVMKQANLKPEETLFLDDRLDNITAAKELGIHTQLVTKENGILTIFKNNY